MAWKQEWPGYAEQSVYALQEESGFPVREVQGVVLFAGVPVNGLGGAQEGLQEASEGRRQENKQRRKIEKRRQGKEGELVKQSQRLLRWFDLAQSPRAA